VTLELTAVELAAYIAAVVRATSEAGDHFVLWEWNRMIKQTVQIWPEKK
jgi:hypothetical protein